MRILVSTSSFGKVGPEPLERLRAFASEVRLNPHGRTLTEDEITGLLQGIDGLVAGVEPLTRDVLAGAAGLKVISRCGVGLDRVDTEAAEELGIAVRNTPDAPTQAVAELALAGLLSVLRRVASADRAVRSGLWTKTMGACLAGKTVGIIGFGRVGRRFAGLLAPFSVRILVYDPLQLERAQLETPSEPALGPASGSASEPEYQAAELDHLLAEADVVSLHAALTDETRDLLDAGAFGRMRPGAVLVNTARGELVDEAALVENLEAGRIGGAYLDVFREEPYRGLLGTFDNVVLTPHVGSYAREARLAMELEAVNNLIGAFGA